jgi:hypothetical protein
MMPTREVVAINHIILESKHMGAAGGDSGCLVHVGKMLPTLHWAGNAGVLNAREWGGNRADDNLHS